MRISIGYKTICNYCSKELDFQKFISLACNDTGYTNDDYYIDYCNINCLKLDKEKDEKEYTKEELSEFSSYYMMNKYLKNLTKENNLK